MTKEKITDTSKKPQDVSNEERLSNEELDNVAGGLVVEGLFDPIELNPNPGFNGRGGTGK